MVKCNLTATIKEFSNSKCSYLGLGLARSLLLLSLVQMNLPLPPLEMASFFFDTAAHGEEVVKDLIAEETNDWCAFHKFVWKKGTGCVTSLM